MDTPKKVLWVSPETHKKIQQLKVNNDYATVDDVVDDAAEALLKLLNN